MFKFPRFGQPDPMHPTAAHLSRPGLVREPAQYNPKLIHKLSHDHNNLLALYQKTLDTFEDGDMQQVKRLLKIFKITLQEHLLLENVRLYAYVSQLSADDPLASERIGQLRRDMNRTGRKVTDFLNRHSTRAASILDKHLFEQELLEIGALLVDQFEREESTLFPMYRPTSA